MVAAFSLLFVSAAYANAVDDGNDGLQALNSGDNDRAIVLFTRAIKGLNGDDQEFAYANRGRAYARKSDYSSAIADLDHARQMKPDDTDAQADLIAVLQIELPADSIPNRPKPSFWSEFGKAVLQGVIQGVANGLAQRQQQ